MLSKFAESCASLSLPGQNSSQHPGSSIWVGYEGAQADGIKGDNLPAATVTSCCRVEEPKEGYTCLVANGSQQPESKLWVHWKGREGRGAVRD